MTSAYSVCPGDSPALSWMSPLNSSFDQTKCISSCFQRCFSHHQLKVKKAAEHKRMNRAFQAKVCQDGLVGWMDGCIDVGDWFSPRWSKLQLSSTRKSMDHLLCGGRKYYHWKAANEYTAWFPPWSGWGKLARCAEKSLNEMNYELCKNERSPSGKWATTKKKERVKSSVLWFKWCLRRRHCDSLSRSLLQSFTTSWSSPYCVASTLALNTSSDHWGFSRFIGKQRNSWRTGVVLRAHTDLRLIVFNPVVKTQESRIESRSERRLTLSINK